MTRGATVAPEPPAPAAPPTAPPSPSVAPPPECFVCASSEGVLLSNICKCTDRYVHLECQRRILALSSHRGQCAVCAAPYNNVVVQRTRHVSSWGWLSIMGCVMSAVTLLMAAIEGVLYHLDPDAALPSSYLIIAGALSLLFLLSLALLHLLARQGSLLVLRAVVKIKPLPAAASPPQA